MGSMFFATGCGGQGNNQAGFALPVTLTTVANAASLDTSDFMAEVNNDNSVVLHASVSGLLKKVLVQDGQSVKAGQPLFVLDSSQQTALTKSLDAQVQSTMQDSTVTDEMLKSLQAERQSILADLKFNQDQLGRYKTLFLTNTVSKKDVEQFETTVNTLSNKLASVDSSISAQRAHKNQSASNAQRDRFTAQSAKANLGFYTIKAPFSGIVGEVAAKPGNYIDTATDLASITNNKQVEVETAVSVDYLRRLKIGGKLQILDTMDTVLTDAVIDFISPKVDKTSQTILVKATINNSKGLLLADQKLKARFIWKTDNSILVPFETVFRMAGQPFVYLAVSKVDHGKSGLIAKMQAVELGPIRGNNYVIQSGLKNDDVIVTGSIQKLQNNMPIQDVSKLPQQPQSHS